MLKVHRPPGGRSATEPEQEELERALWEHKVPVGKTCLLFTEKQRAALHKHIAKERARRNRESGEPYNGGIGDDDEAYMWRRHLAAVAAEKGQDEEEQAVGSLIRAKLLVAGSPRLVVKTAANDESLSDYVSEQPDKPTSPFNRSS